MAQEMIGHRGAKDSVFTDLFGRPEYLFQLYKVLHPEDTDVTQDMLRTVTIHNVLTSRRYNDLGFLVRNKLLILTEAQSTWSVNVIVRGLFYMADTYQEYIIENRLNPYGTKRMPLPQPELYVLYTGDRAERPEEITFSNEFFGGKQTAIDVRVKMLYGDDPNDIVGQYAAFCKVFNRIIKEKGYSQEAIAEILRVCRDKRILAAYMAEHQREVVDIMTMLFNDDYIQEMNNEEMREEGRVEGRVEGRAEGRIEGRAEGRIEGRIEGIIETLGNLVKSGILTIAAAAQQAKMSESDFTAAMRRIPT